MNLSNLTPAWNQLKVVNGLNDIADTEIRAVIEVQKPPKFKALIQRVVQNVFAYSFLILMLNGGCSI